MKNKILIDGKTMVDFQPYVENGHTRYKIVMDDGTEVFPCKGIQTHCDIQCTECGKITHLLFKKSLLSKEYLCRFCRVKGSRNPFYGKHHTQEMKSRQSIHMKKKYSNGNAPNKGKTLYDFLSEEEIKEWKKKLSEANSGKRNPFYGKHHSEELRSHWSKTRKGKCTGKDNPMFGKRLFDCMTKEEYEKWLSHFSETLKRHTSKPEQLVGKWLDEHHIKYKHGYFIFNELSRNSHQFDFHISKTNILIEVQGDYWHGNPRLYSESGDDTHKKLDETQIKKQKTDVVKKQVAESKGYKIIYIWEYDINNGDFGALNQILNIKDIIEE